MFYGELVQIAIANLAFVPNMNKEVEYNVKM